MAGTAIKEKGVAFVPVLALGSPFRMYRSESEHIVRKAEVKQDKAVEGLKQLYRKTKGPDNDPNYSFYNRMADSLKNHHYSSTDVEKFSLALVEFQEDEGFSKKAGSFLSALINNGKDENYILHTVHLAVPISWLGYQNTKNIVVKGNTGDDVGAGMKGGTIVVEGNAGDDVGLWMGDGTIIVEGNAGGRVGDAMSDGTITVKGNAGWRVGESMKAGTITVKGNAGRWIAEAMDGGEIHIEGELGGIAFGLIHGKIYHKGKLIVDK